jgi:hypothetical protein
VDKLQALINELTAAARHTQRAIELANELARQRGDQAKHANRHLIAFLLEADGAGDDDPPARPAAER